MYELMDLGSELTFEELAFAASYIDNKDLEKAALAAGCAKKSAYIDGVRMFKMPKVKQEIDRLRRDISTRLGVDVIDIAREYANMAFFSIEEAYNDDGTLKTLSNMTARARAAISSIDTFEEYEGTGFNRRTVGQVKKVKFTDKLIALDRLAKMLGVDGITKVLTASIDGDSRNVVILPAKND